MGIILGLLGLGIVFISSIFLIISIFRKKEKKNYVIAAAIGLVLCIAGVALDIISNRDTGNNSTVNPDIEGAESLSIDNNMNSNKEDGDKSSFTTSLRDIDTEKETILEPLSYEGLGITRETLTRFFTNDEYGFVFTEETHPDDIPMVIGSSSKHPTARITIVGDKDNIKMTSIMYGIDGKDIVAYDSQRLKDSIALEVELLGLLFPDRFNEVIDWSVSTLERIDLEDEDGLGPFNNTFNDEKITSVYGIANNHVIKLTNIENIKDADNDSDSNDAFNDRDHKNGDNIFITEEEAINAIMTLSEVADATAGEASFEITKYPSEEQPYYEMRVFKDQGTHITTIHFYTVNAYTGAASRKMF